MSLSVSIIGIRRVVYWVATVFVTTAFFVTGIGNLVPFGHIARDMAHLGYPTYFLYILGTWKILGAITIVLPKMPRLREWAYAGMLFDLTGAAISRLASGDGVLMLIVPLAMAGVVVTSWTYSTYFSKNLLR